MNRSQLFKLSIPVVPTDHSIGPLHAPVTVLEYGDFECPNCKQAAPAVKLLLERFAERVRFVYRHFPLEEVHPHAVRAAEAAECAGGQQKFWPMHDLLFDNQAHLKAQHLHHYAERLDLDVARLPPRWTMKSICSACVSTRQAVGRAECAALQPSSSMA